MKTSITSTTEGRFLAISAGIVFVLGTLGILFEDVLTKGAPVALKHGLTIVILAGTIMTGHLANRAWRRVRTWPSAIGFTMVFICGTALVVYSSVGRQVDASVQTSGQIEATNEHRSDIKRLRVKAQAMLDESLNNYYKECRSGDGKQCKGIKSSIDVYTAAVKGHDADLEKLGAPKPVAPEAEQLAEVAHVIFGVDKARTKAAAVLGAPFLITLFLEFGSIVSLGYAFSSRQLTLAPPASVKAIPLTVVANAQIEPPEPVAVPVTADVEKLEPIATPKPVAPKRPRIKLRKTYSQSMALADLLTMTAMNKTIESQDWLAAKWGVPKGTVSRWLAKWENKDLVSRTRVGQFKMTEAA
jgi:hypothetical protein